MLILLSLSGADASDRAQTVQEVAKADGQVDAVSETTHTDHTEPAPAMTNPRIKDKTVTEQRSAACCEASVGDNSDGDGTRQLAAGKMMSIIWTSEIHQLGVRRAG